MATYNDRGHKFKSITAETAGTVTVAADEYAIIYFRSVGNGSLQSPPFNMAVASVGDMMIGEKGEDVICSDGNSASTTYIMTVIICDGSHLA